MLAVDRFTEELIEQLELGRGIFLFQADEPEIAPTLAFYRHARAKGVAVFFVTGRPGLAQIGTQRPCRGRCHCW